MLKEHAYQGYYMDEWRTFETLLDRVADVKDSAPELEGYTRPGGIQNADLIELINETGTKLKPNLQEFYDYVLVSGKAFEFLKAWYGCDYPLRASHL